MSNKIVVHYIDGKIIKGNGYDFSPEKKNFHLMPLNEEGLEKIINVKLSQLKAVFFVKDYDGNPEYKDVPEFIPGKSPYGHRIQITFKDNERMLGSTPGYDLDRLGFFFFPADPQSNNLRVFVVSSAVESIEEVELD